MTNVVRAANTYHNARTNTDYIKRCLKTAKTELIFAERRYSEACDMWAHSQEDFIDIVTLQPVYGHEELVRQVGLSYQKDRIAAEQAKGVLEAAKTVVQELSEKLDLANTKLSEAHEALLEAAMMIVEVTE